MPGEAWTDRQLGLLKRAVRLYDSQYALICQCEPELAERGYDALRVKGPRLSSDVEEVEGLRIDYAPEAVAAQVQALAGVPSSRVSVPKVLAEVDTPQTEPDVVDGKDGGRTVTLVGRHLHTEEELRQHGGFDRERWMCKGVEVNNYQQASKNDDGGGITITTLYQTSAKFIPHPEYDALADFREAILSDIEAHAPTYPEYPDPEPSDDPHLLEFSPFDLHIGKLAWEQETGTDYDTAIAESLLMQATEDVLRKVRGFPIARVLFPLGNDLFNADNPEGNTTRGTRQDMDSRSERVKDRAERLLIHTIDRLATLAPVHVITVPGNHDKDSAQWMGRVLRAWYSRTERVSVDCGPKLRKYERWGPSLIGFTHGSEEKHRDLPLIMATEAATAWSECEQREFHVGHFHKRKETVYSAGDSFNGVRVRVLPSLSGTDAWHAEMGYVKNWRAVESYLWSERSGYVGHLSSNVTTRDGVQSIAA